jgi:hypothetical protein
MRRVFSYSAALVMLSGNVLGETIADYFPLADGNSWSYRFSGPGYTAPRTDTVTGTVVLDGQNTKEIEISGGPDGLEYQYFTNDSQGVRLHGLLLPDEAVAILQPPAVIANSTMEVNETVDSSGRARFFFFGIGTILLDYELSSTFQGFETVTVPADTYETIKLRTVFRIYGTIGEESIDERETSIDWYAENTGVIQSQVEGEPGKAVLLWTNVRDSRVITPILELLLD